MCTYKFTLKKHCLFYCTMTRMSTMESYYPFTYMYCHPILLYVPMTRWMYSIMESYCPFTYTFIILLSIPFYIIPWTSTYYIILLSIYIRIRTYIILLSLWGTSLKMLHNTHVIKEHVNKHK